MNNSIAVGIF